MRRLGEVDLMQPNVIWRRGRRIGLKQRDRNTLRKMPLIGKKNHRDVTANFCLRGYKYFHPDARRITAGDGKGRLCGLICHQQSTCTKNQISKRQVPRLLGLKFCKTTTAIGVNDRRYLHWRAARRETRRPGS
jgi:hypothetical protein